MALYFLETSALVKLYVYETGTERLLRLAESSAEHRFAILSLAQAELRSAIRRQQRGGDIPDSIADQLLDTFQRHAEGRYLIQPLSDSVLDISLQLIDGYALRAFDAMQLAGFLSLRAASGRQEPIFVCADQALLSAAQNEGCLIWNPCASTG